MGGQLRAEFPTTKGIILADPDDGKSISCFPLLSIAAFFSYFPSTVERQIELKRSVKGIVDVSPSPKALSGFSNT